MEKTLGKYKLLRELGKGGMGVIYKGLDPASQKHVAIKVLPSMMVDRNTVERFNREAKAMTKLKHKNVIDVLDFGMEKGQHYLVMDYIEGGDLKTVIKKKGALSVTETLEIVTQVLDALVYTHGEGIIHRDIKPANIMITEEGKVRVMDFGLAKIMGASNLTVEGSSLGTADYMSPEQASGEEVDSRTDIYSLGATMYEMLTGRPPFKADTLHALLMKHKYENAQPIREVQPNIPQRLEEIITKALAKDLSQRYQRAQDLLDDLYAFKGIRPSAQNEAMDDTEQISVAKQSLQDTMAETQTMKSPPKRANFKISMTNMVARLIFVALILGGIYFLSSSQKENISEIFSSMGSKISLPQGKRGEGLLAETERDLKRLEKADRHYSEGLIQFTDGNVDKAISEYRKAIKIRGNYPLYYKELADAYEVKKEFKKAINAWNDLLKYDESGEYTQQAKEKIRVLSAQ